MKHFLLFLLLYISVFSVESFPSNFEGEKKIDLKTNTKSYLFLKKNGNYFTEKELCISASKEILFCIFFVNETSLKLISPSKMEEELNIPYHRETSFEGKSECLITKENLPTCIHIQTSTEEHCILSIQTWNKNHLKCSLKSLEPPEDFEYASNQFYRF